MSAWTSIPEKERKAIWDRFYAKFDFKPHTRKFPAIIEPVPSVTYSFARFAAPIAHRNRRMDDPEGDLRHVALRIFATIAKPSGRVVALDWQHECFYFEPRRFSGKWKIPAMPDGDYSIFLSEDMRNGWFAHPWEETICIFGERAIASLEVELPVIFSVPIRKDGRSTLRQTKK
jgi:hypothetical protein